MRRPDARNAIRCYRNWGTTGLRSVALARELRNFKALVNSYEKRVRLVTENRPGLVLRYS